MQMVRGLVQIVLAFIAHYGLLAVFVYMLLETSLLLHFVPSELVIPIAASQLVTGPLSFLAFIFVTTTGATIGALVPYFLFATFGRDALVRYGRYVHLSPDDLDRGDRWFQQWGELSVFWGRLLPFVRVFVSVPAGVARMNVRRFIVYSTGGALIYNTALTYVVYTGSRAGSPINLVVQSVVAVITLGLVYVRTHPLLVGIAILILLGVALFLWMHREWIRAHPAVAKRRMLRALRLCGLILGLLFLTSAVSVPQQAFALVAWAWNDPLLFLALGASKRLALILTGFAIISLTFLGTELGKRLPITEMYRTVRQMLQK